MAIEIERKFLVARDKLPSLIDGTLIRQAYIPTANGTTVRIRLAGELALLGIKTAAVNFTRQEYEYPIPVSDAREMLDQVCSDKLIEKHRYLIEHGGLTWEIDVFHGSNEGLIVAEVELESEQQNIELPDWVLEEVTCFSQYSNNSLATSPYCTWSS